MPFERDGTLTPREVQEIINSIEGNTEEDLRDRALIVLIFNLVRLSEALEMQVADVDLRQGRLIVPKFKGHFGGRSSIILPCSQPLANVLGSYLKKRGDDTDPNAPLFPARRKHQHAHSTSYLSSAVVNSMIRRRAKVAGILADANSQAIRRAAYSLITGESSPGSIARELD